MSEDGKGRDEYTWTDVTRDLALTTPLTQREAGAVVFEVRDAGVHPHDVFPHLRVLFSGEAADAKGRALRLLLQTGKFTATLG